MVWTWLGHGSDLLWKSDGLAMVENIVLSSATTGVLVTVNGLAMAWTWLQSSMEKRWLGDGSKIGSQFSHQRRSGHGQDSMAWPWLGHGCCDGS